ncbi:hypothetical protein DXG01_013109 [Tephrocybe rancida]|nr:hypothetical protein DXG01_013109 [Tephrocybe rancida]
MAAVVGGTVIGVALTPIAAPAVLGLVGFGAAGPIAGGIAAGIQAGAAGNIAAGSAFALAQSIAMGGAAVPALGLAAGGGIAGGATFLLTKVAGLSPGGDETAQECTTDSAAPVEL